MPTILQSRVQLNIQFYLLSRPRETNFNYNKAASYVVDIALCFRLRLPSCSPGFESQAHHLHLFNLQANFVLYLSLNFEKDENKHKKRLGLALFKIQKDCLIT